MTCGAKFARPYLVGIPPLHEHVGISPYNRQRGNYDGLLGSLRVCVCGESAILVAFCKGVAGISPNLRINRCVCDAEHLNPYTGKFVSISFSIIPI